MKFHKESVSISCHYYWTRSAYNDYTFIGGIHFDVYTYISFYSNTALCGIVPMCTIK